MSDGPEIIAQACFSGSKHQKKYPTDRKSVQQAPRTVSFKLASASKSGPTLQKSLAFTTAMFNSYDFSIPSSLKSATCSQYLLADRYSGNTKKNPRRPFLAPSEPIWMLGGIFNTYSSRTIDLAWFCKVVFDSYHSKSY